MRQPQLRDVKDFDWLRLIAINAYVLYHNTCIGNAPPIIQEQFERIRNPQPGDLVVETSTIWRWARHAVEAKAALRPEIGILLRVVQEPLPREEGSVEPEDGATETVWYVQPLDGSVPEYRWVNASFIQVQTGLR